MLRISFICFLYCSFVFPLTATASYNNSYLNVSRNYAHKKGSLNESFEQGDMEIPKTAQIEVIEDFPNEKANPEADNNGLLNKTKNSARVYRGAFDTYANQKNEFTMFMQNQRLQTQIILTQYENKLSNLQVQIYVLLGYNLLLSVLVLGLWFLAFKERNVSKNEVQMKPHNNNSVAKRDFLS